MRNYRGYYIDGFTFKNEQEIDAFIEKQAVDGYKRDVKLFAADPSMEGSIAAGESAERLVKQFGYTWEQVEAIEIEVYEAIA